MDMELFTETQCKYPADAGQEIAKRLISGQSMHDIIKTIQDVWPGITRGAVYWWMVGGQSGGAAGVLAAQYARIREAQGARLGQLAVELIDQQARGEGDFRTARVALDGIKWISGRLDRSRWGDNLNVQHSGSVTLQAIVEQAQSQRKQLIDQARSRAVIEGDAIPADDSESLSDDEGD